MVNKEPKKPYEGAFVEILLLEKKDVITTSDLFNESGNPGDSSSSGSWTQS